jgi:hypothetical protein
MFRFFQFPQFFSKEKFPKGVGEFFIHYAQLPRDLQKISILKFFFFLGNMITMIFLGPYVWTQGESLGSLLFFNVVYWSCIFIGFCPLGWLASNLGWSLRSNLWRGFSFMALAYIFLGQSDRTLMNTIIFAAVNGIGVGTLFSSFFAYEQLHTHDENSDFYSSTVVIFMQIAKISIPLLVSCMLFMETDVFFWKPFTVVFNIIPFIFIGGLFLVFRLPKIYPHKVSLKKIHHLIETPSLKLVWMYLISAGFILMMPTFLPLVAMHSLKSINTLGWVNTAAAIISTAVLFFLCPQLKSPQRTRMFVAAASITSIGLLFLTQYQTIPETYLIFLFVQTMMEPIYTYPIGAYGLSAIKLVRETGNVDGFMAAQMHDMFCYFGRLLAFTALYVVYLFTSFDENLTIQICIILAIINLYVIATLGKKVTLRAHHKKE